MKSIKGIQPQLQEIIDGVIKNLLERSGYSGEGITGHVCDVNRGLAYYGIRSGLFSVPFWAYKKDGEKPGYFIYYVAHELSHQLAFQKYGSGCNHDYRFYEIFMRVCPQEYQKYELGYKKTSAKYGISN